MAYLGPGMTWEVNLDQDLELTRVVEEVVDGVVSAEANRVGERSVMTPGVTQDQESTKTGLSGV